MSPIIYLYKYIKDLARAPEIVPSIFYFFLFFLFFRFFFDFFDFFFARTVYITIQSDRVYIKALASARGSEKRRKKNRKKI